MPLILNIETATKTCSVALAETGKLVAHKEMHGVYGHSENLTCFIEEVMKDAGKQLKDLDAVAVSRGPGSYTGLRIGVSTAKGLCYAINKPLIAISTLEGMLEKFLIQSNKYDFYCPMIDARRMEVYCSVFENKTQIDPIKALIVQDDSFDDFLKRGKMVLFGDGAEKLTELFREKKHLEIVAGFEASATGMIEKSFKKFLEKSFEDLAYFEPFYLKDFIGTIPKKK